MYYLGTSTTSILMLLTSLQTHQTSNDDACSHSDVDVLEFTIHLNTSLQSDSADEAFYVAIFS